MKLFQNQCGMCGALCPDGKFLNALINWMRIIESKLI